MFTDEEIARIKVREALQKGLQSQRYQRSLPNQNKPLAVITLLVILLPLFFFILLVIG